MPFSPLFPSGPRRFFLTIHCYLQVFSFFPFFPRSRAARLGPWGLLGARLGGRAEEKKEKKEKTCKYQWIVRKNRSEPEEKRGKKGRSLPLGVCGPPQAEKTLTTRDDLSVRKGLVPARAPAAGLRTIDAPY